MGGRPLAVSRSRSPLEPAIAREVVRVDVSGESRGILSDAPSRKSCYARCRQGKALLKAKAAFVVPATLFFVVYYFALPVLVGWFPALMEKRIGPVNLAYIFALSQFFMAWIVAYVYLRKASKFDEQQNAIIAKLALPKGGEKS